MTALAGLDADQAFTSMEQRMMKLSMAFATGALLIAAAPSFAGNTTASDSSPSHNAGRDSARDSAPHRNGRTGVSTPSDSGSAGTITNGQSAQMPTSPSATRQDTDTGAPSGTDPKAGNSSHRSRSGSSASETAPAR